MNINTNNNQNYQITLGNYTLNLNKDKAHAVAIGTAAAVTTMAAIHYAPVVAESVKSIAKYAINQMPPLEARREIALEAIEKVFAAVVTTAKVGSFAIKFVTFLAMLSATAIMVLVGIGFRLAGLIAPVALFAYILYKCVNAYQNGGFN